MKYNILREGIKVSELSFGCSRLGKSFAEDTTKTGPAILQLAYDLGINFFDTSSNYSYGDSERMLGDFMRKVDNNIVFSTKGGTKLSEKGKYAQYLRPLFKYLKPFIGKNKSKIKNQKVFNFSYDYLLKRIDLSIKRMGTSIPIYFIHSPGEEALKGTDIPRLFETIKKEDKAKLTGLSLKSLDEINQCNYIDDIDILQFPINYIEFSPDLPEQLSRLRDKKIGLVGRTPFGRGILTKDGYVKTGMKKGSNNSEVKIIREELISRHNVSEIQLALWFLKDLDLLDSVLFSSFNPDHLKQNVALYETSVPDSFSWKDMVQL